MLAGEPEGDPASILRVADDNTWFAVSDNSRQPVWIEVQFPESMRVVELSKYTFSHGLNMASHMFPYGISDSQWFSMKVSVVWLRLAVVILLKQALCDSNLHWQWVLTKASTTSELCVTMIQTVVTDTM